MSKKRATVEYVKTGQQRPYGDSITEAIVTIEFSNYFKPDEFKAFPVNEAHAKDIAKALVGWVDGGDWFETYLDSFTDLGDGRYRVVTRARYTD